MELSREFANLASLLLEMASKNFLNYENDDFTMRNSAETRELLGNDFCEENCLGRRIKAPTWLAMKRVAEKLKKYAKECSLETNWKCGVKDEILFWRGWLTRNKDSIGKSSELCSFLKPLIGDKKEVTIADIGCGAVSLIGNTYKDVDIKIYPSDICAEEYKKLKEELNIDDGLLIEKQDMTNLSYDSNTFDIVYCGNALDHCINPRAAISEMIRVCKPGGWILLRHFERVGKKAGYKNLHQWNLEIVDDDCVIWNKNVSFKLSEFSVKFEVKQEKSSFIECCGRKEGL